MLYVSFVDTREAARTLKVTPDTMKKWRDAGKGPYCFKRGNRHYYPLKDLYEFSKTYVWHGRLKKGEIKVGPNGKLTKKEIMAHHGAIL